MYKNIIAVLALALVAVNAQNVTSGNSTGSCRATSDCVSNQCCAYSKTGAVNYVQFECVGFTRNATSGFLNSNNTVFTCMQPNQNYTEVCAAEDRICTSSASKFTICGGSFATGAVALVNRDLTCSNAFTLVSSVLFAAIASLALVF